MRQIFTLFSLLLTGIIANAQCTDLFFSEYLEGSSNNKALEIYNPTQAAVNMNDYALYRFNNGATSASDSLFPQGTLNAGDVFVIGNPSADTAITNQSDTLGTMTFFNGDDAILLVNRNSGDTLDIIGIIGVDPGTNWTVGSGATSEFTLVRMPSINEGTADWNLSSTQWLVLPQNTFDSLGAHTMTPCSFGPGCSNDLFFSEYIEGSSSNKAMEIYNPMDTVVDLTSYVVYRYNNGSFTATDSLFPQGTLDPDSVWVFANPSASAAVLAEADTLHTLTFYNGDDAVALINRNTGDTLDIIGVIGVDPGAGWTVGTGATNNFTLVRMPTVQQGETDWNIAVNQWIVRPIDTFDSLGFHNMNNCTATQPLSISFVGAAVTVNEAVGTVNLTLAISQAPTANTDVEIALTGGSATNGSDFTFTSPTTVTWVAGDTTDKQVTVQITDDLLTENTESIEFALQNATSPAMIGAGSYTILIEDNDIPTYPIGTISSVDGNGVVDSLGVTCRVIGIVYGGNVRPSGLQFTMIDSTGGIGVFDFNQVSGYTVTEGDEIALIGTVGQFNGLAQMDPDSIEVLSTGNTLKIPTSVTTLGENTESDLVKLKCVTLVDTAQWTGSGSGFNVDVTNGVDTVQVRIDADVDLYNDPVPMGTLNIIGLGGQFDNSSPYTEGYQLLPRYRADIEMVADPVAGFTSTQNGVNTIDFTNSSTGAQGYEWDFGDGNTSLDSMPTHTYATAGQYTVTLIAYGECSNDTATQVIDVLVGVEDPALAGIELYPNPTTGMVNIDLGGLTGENIRIIATDPTGKIVYTKDIVQVVEQFERLNLTGMANGLFLIRVETEKGIFTGKVIVRQ